MDDRIDLFLLRPRSLASLQGLGELRAAAPAGWSTVLRWAGRNLVARGLSPQQAAALSAPLQGAGFQLERRPAAAPSNAALAAQISRPVGALLAALAAAGAWLWLHADGNPLAHAGGFLLYNFVVRDRALVMRIGSLLAVPAALGCGALAWIVWLVLLERLRLTQPLLDEAAVFARLAPGAAAAPAEPAAQGVRPPDPEQARPASPRRLRWLLVRVGIVALGAALATVTFWQARTVPFEKLPAARVLPPAPRTLGEALAQVAQDGVLPPDARLLRATALLGQLAGEPAEAVAAEGGLALTVGKQRVVLGPEAGFAEALAALRSLAPQGRARLITLAEAPLSDTRALAELRSVQRRWSAGERDGLLGRAAGALASLSLACAEHSGPCDEVDAAALAALAAAEASTGVRLWREEILVAHAFGSALAMADGVRHLQASDPLGAFALRDGKRVQGAARRTPEDALLLVESGLFRGAPDAYFPLWEHALRAAPHSVALQSLLVRTVGHLPRGAWEPALDAQRAALEYELASELAEPAGPLPALASLRHALARADDWMHRSQGSAARLDALVARAGHTGAGPFYSPALVEAHFRAAWEGALHAFPGGNEALLDLLGSGPSRRSQQLRTWLGALSQPTWFREPAPALAALAGARSLPRKALRELLSGVKSFEAFGAREQAARLALAQLDSRAQHAELAAQLLWESLGDPEAARAACRSLLRFEPLAAGPGELICRYLGGREPLLAMAQDPQVPASERAHGWTLARERRFATPAEADDALAGLLPQDGPQGMIADRYARDLELQRRYQEALAPLRAFRARFPQPTIEAENLRMLEARLLVKAGDYRAAMEVTAPIVDGHRGAQLYATLARAGLGERVDLVKFLRGRERDDLFQIRKHQLVILWRLGEHAAAAELVGRPEFTLDEASWPQLYAEAFATAFDQRPDAAASAAFAALVSAGVLPRRLGWVADALAAEGRGALAHRLLASTLDAQRPDETQLLRAARLLGAAAGDEAALSWLASHRGAARPEALLLAAFEAGFPRAACTLPAPTDDAGRLRRATACPQDPPSEAEQARLPLLAVLAGAPPGPLLALARPPAEVARTAWALGARADAEGKTLEAGRYYRAAARADPTTAEARWASRRLRQWSDEAGKGTR